MYNQINIITILICTAVTIKTIHKMEDAILFSSKQDGPGVYNDILVVVVLHLLHHGTGSFTIAVTKIVQIFAVFG